MSMHKFVSVQQSTIVSDSVFIYANNQQLLDMASNEDYHGNKRPSTDSGTESVDSPWNDKVCL
jgi:hypothetical protein